MEIKVLIDEKQKLHLSNMMKVKPIKGLLVHY